MVPSPQLARRGRHGGGDRTLPVVGNPDHASAGEEIGIWAGAAAVGLLVLTAFAGSGLSGAKRDSRRRIRRNHVATMFAVLAVGIVHTALNGPLAGR